MTNQKLKSVGSKPGTDTIWTYWETPEGRSKPAHIELCHRALAANRGDDLNFQLIGPADLATLDLELHERWTRLSEPAHRADYLRVALLAKYGGFWVDSDVITIRPFSAAAKLLEENDFVAWEYRSGTSGKEVTFRVPISCFGVLPGIPLMTTWLGKMHDLLETGQEMDRNSWHALGRDIMNPLLKQLVESGDMRYHAMHAEALTIPIKAKARAEFFAHHSVAKYIRDTPLQPHINYFNSWMPQIQPMTEEELLSGTQVISKLFQYALLPDRRAELLAEGTGSRSLVTELPKLKAALDTRDVNTSRQIQLLLARTGQLETQVRSQQRQIQKLVRLQKKRSTTVRKLRKLVRNPGLFFRDFASKRFGKSSKATSSVSRHPVAGKATAKASETAQSATTRAAAKKMSEVEERFTGIYKSKRWGNKRAQKETLSGNGSTLRYTENIRKELPVLVDKLGVTSVFDAPCGDFNWFKAIEWKSEIKYLGADVVREIVERNQDRYQNGNRQFIPLDIIAEELPDLGANSLWLCRDCLFHLSYEHIFQVLNSFAQSNFSYFLTSIHTEHLENKDIKTGGFRTLNLERDPFNLPQAQVYLKDWIEPYRVRYLGLWARDDVSGWLTERNRMQTPSGVVMASKASSELTP